MNTSFVSSSSLPGTQSVLQFEVQGFRLVYTLVAVALIITVRGLDVFKVLQRMVWFFDHLLGGAPHTVSLPGPPGLPLVGNLIQVG